MIVNADRARTWSVVGGAPQLQCSTSLVYNTVQPKCPTILYLCESVASDYMHIHMHTVKNAYLNIRYCCRALHTCDFVRFHSKYIYHRRRTENSMNCSTIKLQILFLSVYTYLNRCRNDKSSLDMKRIDEALKKKSATADRESIVQLSLLYGTGQRSFCRNQ